MYKATTLNTQKLKRKRAQNVTALTKTIMLFKQGNLIENCGRQGLAFIHWKMIFKKEKKKKKKANHSLSRQPVNIPVKFSCLSSLIPTKNNRYGKSGR